MYLVSHYFVFAIRLSCGKKDAVVEARVCVCLSLRPKCPSAASLVVVKAFIKLFPLVLKM